MNADDELLASAYLDGELTDEERRIAESNPAVMAEVEQLRALHDELAAVEPPSAAAREGAISAALGAFQALHPTSSTSAPGPAPVTEIARWRDPTRWLGAAAAVLVVGLLGVVVAANLRGGDDDSASDSVDEVAAFEPASEPAEEPASEAVVRSAADEDASDGADQIAESADDAQVDDPDTAMSATADEPASEPADDAEAAGDMADDIAGASTTAPAVLVPLADPEEYLDGRAITNPDELGWVGRHLLDLVERRELPPTPNHACPVPDVLARGVLLDGATEVEIYIAATADPGEVFAIDQETCRVLLESALRP